MRRAEHRAGDAILPLLVAAAVLCVGAGCDKQEDVGSAKPLKESLLVYCAGGMRPPIAKLAEEFQAQHGARINLTYGGANILLGQIELARKGDVYIPGDADYLGMAARKGLVKSQKPISYFVPVLIVQKGNPKGLKTLADLTRPDVRIGQGDLKACAVGRLMHRLLEMNGVDPAAWQKNVKLTTPMVNGVALKVKLRMIDGGVVWRCIAARYSEDSTIVELDPQKNICPVVAGAVLSFSKNPAAAAAFLDFLASERGRQVLTENGYTVTKP